MFWSRNDARVLRTTICYRYLASISYSSAKKYDLLSLLLLRCREEIRVVAVILASKWCPNTKNNLSPFFCAQSGAPVLRSTICCRCFGRLRSGDPALKRTVCCRCLGLDAVPQCEEIRFVAVVWVMSSVKKYDLLFLNCPRCGVQC